MARSAKLLCYYKNESMKITIGVFNRQKIMQEALCSLLSVNEDYEAIALVRNLSSLAEELHATPPNILLFSLSSSGFDELKLISQLHSSYPKMGILILSSENDEDLILKTIKAGAKGFLDKEAGYKELSEAIYTIRAGYDFYSETITHLLLGKYLKKIKTKESLTDPGVESLSARQIEIIRLWGNNMSNKEIADKLFISVRTVESHKNHIMQRLNLKTNIDMIKFGIKNNLIDI